MGKVFAIYGEEDGRYVGTRFVGFLRHQIFV